MPAQDALTEAELEAFLKAVSKRGPSGKRNLALLTLMADTGLRLGEALALQTTALVREGAGRVVTHVRVVGKGKKPALVPVTARAAARIDTWLQARAALGLGNGALFCTISRGTHARPLLQASRGQQAVGDSSASSPRARGHPGPRKGENIRHQELKPGRPLNPRYVRQVVQRVARKAGIDRRVTPHTLRHTFATHLLRKTGNLELTRKALRHSRITTTAAIYSHLADRDVEEAVRNLRQPPPPGPEDATVQKLAQALASLPDEARRALLAALWGD
ncbi:MAG: tyrosine-type recombinase/integrase [Armatimonadetes bacterium]|nr:tyrosine-type recombinase/integrase [Armatimonadota bacterium]